MQQRKLADLEVSAIGLGCMGMSHGYGSADAGECERVLLRALDLGCTFFDTASVYGLGHNERLLGRVLRSRRDRFVLASKCGIVVEADGRRSVDGRPCAIRKTCEQSLERLRTDVIDLYYLHRRDQAVPIEESVGGLGELVREGKIRAIGLSEVSSDTLRRAHREHPITAVQSEYSLWTRNPEQKVLEACQQLGVGFVPFAPVGRGFLAGAVRDLEQLEELEEHDMRRQMPRFQGEDFERNLALLSDFGAIAEECGCSMAQLALIWLLAQGAGIVPIPGTTRVGHLEELLAAADRRVPIESLERAGRLINADTVAGARYASAHEISLDPEPRSGSDEPAAR